MSIAVSYTDYMLSENVVPIGEYVEQLDEDYVKEYGKIFFGSELKKQELAMVLSQVSKITEVRKENRENEPDMFSKLIDKYIESKNVNVEEIDYIIYTRGNSVIGEATDPYFAREKNVPYMIQKKYNMKNATVFCIEQECSAALMAVNLAKSLVESSQAKRVLIMSSCFMQYEPLRLMGLFTVSDGVGILEVSKDEEGLEIVDFESLSDGEVARVQDFTIKADKVVSNGSVAMSKVLERNGIAENEVIIIPQNTPSSSWNMYCKKMNLSLEKIYLDNVARLGHLGDVDMAINITDALNNGFVKKDDYMIAFAVGTGTTWNALLLKA